MEVGNWSITRPHRWWSSECLWTVSFTSGTLARYSILKARICNSQMVRIEALVPLIPYRGVGGLAAEAAGISNKGRGTHRHGVKEVANAQQGSQNILQGFVGFQLLNTLFQIHQGLSYFLEVDKFCFFMNQLTWYFSLLKPRQARVNVKSEEPLPPPPRIPSPCLRSQVWRPRDWVWPSVHWLMTMSARTVQHCPVVCLD